MTIHHVDVYLLLVLVSHDVRLAVFQHKHEIFKAQACPPHDFIRMRFFERLTVARTKPDGIHPVKPHVQRTRHKYQVAPVIVVPDMIQMMGILLGAGELRPIIRKE